MRVLTAFVLMFFCPFFFASNAIFGRMAQDIEPFTLAFIRWFATGCLLLAISGPQWPRMVKTWAENWPLFLGLGWLGMWLAGGVVYFALHHTTATNGLLIYTLPPAIVILIEYLVKGRQSRPREWLGIFIALAGVTWIIAAGDLSRLAALRFNPGDLLFLAAAIGWAFYTFGVRSERVLGLSALALLSVTALTGSLVILPFMIWELLDPSARPFPHTIAQWRIIAGIVVTASLAAFGMYNFGVRVLGASVASIFMYLLAPFGILEAWLFLGEQMQSFHWWGAGLVIGGVMLATLPLPTLPLQFFRK